MVGHFVSLRPFQHQVPSPSENSCFPMHSSYSWPVKQFPLAHHGVFHFPSAHPFALEQSHIPPVPFVPDAHSIICTIRKNKPWRNISMNFRIIIYIYIYSILKLCNYLLGRLDVFSVQFGVILNSEFVDTWLLRDVDSSEVTSVVPIGFWVVELSSVSSSTMVKVWENNL